MEARAPLGAVPMPHDRMVSKDRFQELLYTVYIYGWWFLSKKYARHLNQLYFFYVLFNNVQHHLVGGFNSSEKY